MTTRRTFVAAAVSYAMLTAQSVIAPRQSCVSAQEKHPTDNSRTWGPHLRKLVNDYFDAIEKYGEKQQKDSAEIKKAIEHARDETDKAVKKLNDLVEKYKLGTKLDEVHTNENTYPPGHQPPPPPPPPINEFLNNLETKAAAGVAGNEDVVKEVKEAFATARHEIIKALQEPYKAAGGK